MIIDIKKHLKLLAISIIVAIILSYLAGYFHAIMGDFSKIYTMRLTSGILWFEPITQLDYVIMIFLLLIITCGFLNSIFYFNCFVDSRKPEYKIVVISLGIFFSGIILCIGFIMLLPSICMDIYCIKKYNEYNYLITFLKSGSIYNM